MLDLAPVLTRLKAECPRFRVVDFALNASASINDIKAWPSLYLLQGQDHAQSNSVAAGAHVQRVVMNFQLVYFINATAAATASGRRAAQAADELAAATAEVQRALVGWSWSPHVDPLEYQTGSLLGVNERRMVFAETYTTAHLLRITR